MNSGKISGSSAAIRQYAAQTKFSSAMFRQSQKQQLPQDAQPRTDARRPQFALRSPLGRRIDTYV